MNEKILLNKEVVLFVNEVGKITKLVGTLIDFNEKFFVLQNKVLQTTNFIPVAKVIRIEIKKLREAEK